MGPQLLSQILPMGGSTGPAAPVARPPAPDPFAIPHDPFAAQAGPPARAYDPQMPMQPPSEEEARIIEGLLKSGQFNDIFGLAMQDARRPSMYMFDRDGGVRGAVDSDKRLGFGALASLLGADADRYGQNMADNQFQDELDFRRMPFEQMTAADQEMMNLRREEMQQRGAQAMMPYERMTPYEQGTLDIERDRVNSRDPLVEMFAPAMANNPDVMNKVMSRIMGQDYAPAPPAALREQMADQVNDNEVSGIVQERIGKPREEWTMRDYENAYKTSGEGLWEQVKSGDRSYESALEAARRDDNDPDNPKAGVTVEGVLKKMKAAHDKVQENIRQTRKRLKAPETGIGMEGIPYGGRW